MKGNENKELDILLKKMVKEAGLESPSVHFTDQILYKIQHVKQQSSATVYQPLISRTTWGLLAMALLGIFFYSIFGTVNSVRLWSSIENIDFLSKYDLLTKLANSPISETLSYSILGLSFFVYLQLYLLKRYMDKRVSLM